MARQHRPSPRRGLVLVWTCCWCCILLLGGNGGGVAGETSSSTGDDNLAGSNDDASANSDCDASSSGMIGDALCDFDLNVAACGYDGGDCCECTCIDTDEQACGEGGAGYFCLDPDAPQDCGATGTPAPTVLASNTSGDPTSDTSSDPTSDTSSDPTSDTSATYPGCGGYLPHMGDGFCDEDLNNAACGFDGGDCCACTCGGGTSTETDSLDHSCGYAGDGFNCRDPDVPADCGATPSPAASYGYPDCTGYMYDWQDSYCDYDLNNEECGWDGGDCCRCTCREYSSWSTTCGIYGYDCMDPEAPDTCSTESPTPSPAAGTDYPECEGTIFSIGDGFCQSSNNNEECDWDGGDCCPCTCEESSWYYSSCGYYGFDCLDPDVSTECSPAPTPAPTLDPYPDCTGSFSIGDGYCDSYYNTEECGWDGGDCCPCTCDDPDYYSSCGYYGYDCMDPTVSTDCITTSTQTTYGGGTDDDTTYCPLNGDGRCDTAYNTEECDWDGGDCCECDCVGSTYSCGYYGFDCLDPASTCFSSSTFAGDDAGIDSDDYIDRTDDDAGIDSDDYSDRGFGDSSTAAIPANQQEAWAGDAADSSFTKVEIGGVIALSVWGFCMLGWCIWAACGCTRRGYFEDNKGGAATRGETAGSYSVKSRRRRSPPSGEGLQASVAAALAIPPEDAEGPAPADKTNSQRFGSARQSSLRGVHPDVEESKADEKREVDAAFYASGGSVGGVDEAKREDPGASDGDGGRGDAAGSYAGVSAGADAADPGGGEKGGDVAADADPAPEAVAATRPAVAADIDPSGASNDGVPGDGEGPARGDEAAGAGTAVAADEKVVAGASEPGADDGAVGATGGQNESAGASLGENAGSSAQPAEGAAGAEGVAEGEQLRSVDAAVDDGDTARPAANDGT